MANITDQVHDASQRDFIKFASRLQDRELAEELAEVFPDAQAGGLEKRAWAWPGEYRFPVDSPEDTMLSRLYFNNQREKIASENGQDVANDIDENLQKWEELHNVHADFSNRNMFKTAAAPVVTIMPGYEVKGRKGLKKAAAEFNDKYLGMTIGDRYVFATGFIKAAHTLDCMDVVPESVRVYSGLNDIDKDELLTQLEFRKVACERAGKDPTSYAKLAHALEDVDFDESTQLDRVSLATSIYGMDKRAGFTSPSYDRRLPDAFAIVFNKSAEEADNDSHTSGSGDAGDGNKELSKADIIARYGEDAIEALEDESGKIDYKKLERLKQRFGDSEETSDINKRDGLGSNGR